MATRRAVGIHKILLNVGKVRHPFAIEVAVGRMGDGLIKGMGANADASPAQVEFPHVDGVESRIPGIPAPGQDVLIRNGIAVEGIFGHISLPRYHILDALVMVMPGIHHEKDIFVRFRILAEGGYHGRLIPVTDIVFSAVGHIAVFRQRGEGHLRGIEIRPVGLFGQTERKNGPFVEKFGGFLFYSFILAHPDGTQPQDGHLPGIPVGQAIKRQDFIEVAIAERIPAVIRMAFRISGRGEQCGKDLVFL